MRAGTGKCGRSTFLSMAACVPLTLVLIAMLEAWRPTIGWYGSAVVLRAWVFALALHWSYEPLLSGLALAVEVVLLASVAKTLVRGSLRLWISVAMAGATTLFQYGALVEYDKFAGYLPFQAAAVAYFLFLAVCAGLLVGPDADSPSRRLCWLYAASAAISFVGAAACVVVNFTYLLRLYPTLHLCLFQMSFTLLCIGLLLTRACLVRGKRGQRVARYLLQYPGVASLVLMVGSIACAIGAPLTEKTYFRHFTTPGEYRMMNSLALDILADIPRTPVSRDPQALARFAEHSRFPGLPEDFSLTDYNVLLITVEATRFDKTSLHDAQAGNTPAMLDLAESAALSFSWAFSPASGTYQSIAALFAMTYPSAVDYCLRSRAWAGSIPPGPIWVPKLFHDAGYATFWVGYDGRAGTFTRQIRGFEHGFSTWRLTRRDGRVEQYERRADIDIKRMAIEEINRATARQQRFFGWVFFVSPHDDYIAHYPDRPANSMEERYEQEIRHMDEQVGELIGHLRNRGLLNETVVILTSDHGEEFYEHGGQQHRSSVYNEQTRVPLVVRVPGMNGRQIEAPTSLVYLFPWLLQRGTSGMRAAAQERLEADIGPMMRAVDGAVVMELMGVDKNYAGLVHGGFKIVFNFHSQLYELYDLAADPSEQTNLAFFRPELMESSRWRFEEYVRVQRANRRYRSCREMLP